MPQIQPFDPPSKLIAYVREELSKKEDLSRIALDSKVPRPWLKLFVQGCIPNPGVARIEKLYEYLSGKKLKV